MRILYLHQYFNTPEMPGSTRSYEFARRLVADGHSVTLVTSDCRASSGGWQVTDEAGISVHWLPVPYSNKSSYMHRIFAFLKFALRSSVHASRIQCDVVFATSTPLTIAIPGMIASRRQRVPLVFEVRDLWPKVPIEMGILTNPVLKWAALKLEEVAYRRSAAIIALSPGMAEHVSDVAGSDKSVHVIPNGCDMELFDEVQIAGDELRAANEWLGSGPLVLYGGTLGFVNDPTYLAELAFAVRELDVDIRFVVLGTGGEEDALRRRAVELDVLDRNLHLLGQVDKRLSVSWLCACDIALSMIRDDPLFWRNATTNKVFDAIAAGTPVVANHAGWQMDILVEAGAGLVVSAFDPREAGEAIVALLRDDDRMTSMGKSGRCLAESRFSRDSHAAMLEVILQGVVNL